MSDFTLTLHPAADGDALLLAWGPESDRHHALIDLGRQGNGRALLPRLAAIGRLDLFVVTHVDADHIAGAMPLVDDAAAPFAVDEVWFNGREQLVEAVHRRAPREILGALQGERFTDGVTRFGWPRNTRFASRIVSRDSPEAAAPIAFPGGLTLRLLSPTDARLAALLPDWDAEIAAAALRAGEKVAAEPEALPSGRETFAGAPDVDALAAEPFRTDRTSANGSSIAFLAEYAGRRVLFGADAHPDVLVEAIAPLAAAEGGRLRVDCFKVSHHGSRANTSPQLLALLDCTRFLYSTDGSRHGHPDPQAIARVLVADRRRPKRLCFNFRRPKTEMWDVTSLKKAWHYDCVFPAGDGDPLVVEI